MSQNQISTISEFLLHAGTDYRVFDMGRTIRPLTSQQFLDLENNAALPGYPRSQHAWFGLVFWDKTRSEQQYIWFVKLPLDEQGALVAAARNHFLQIIIDALGSQLENTEKKNGQLPENPYTFIPNQHQLADFNSISRHNLKLGQSQYHPQAWAYLQSPAVVDWQQVALQGLADVVAQLDDPSVCQTLITQFDNYPQAVQFSLLMSFENHPLPDELRDFIISWLAQPAQQQPLIWQHGLRALCQRPGEPVNTLLDDWLTTDMRHEPDLLTVIAGRLWQALNQPQRLSTFMHAVAQADPSYGLFQGIFRDLVQQPDLRAQVLNLLRDPDKSAALTQAVGSLFADTQVGS